MKLALLILSTLATSHAVQLQLVETPISRVTELLREMRARIESDGKLEQMSYDKYACWCEESLAEKASDINGAQQQIKDLQEHIIRLGGELGAHGAEIEQLEKDIAANLESQREAAATREGSNADYEGTKTETEQCIGALESAIKALAGAGTGASFLSKEVEVLSVASGVRHALQKAPASRSFSQEDLGLIRHFIERPAEFVGHAGRAMSAAQVAENPFGDYAPQSTRIQGVLKGMYDAFATDLEKANAEEADSEKAFRNFMQTKQAELETLRATLGSQQEDDSKKKLDKAERNELLDDTKAQLDADEKFFAETKEGCKRKSRQWASRSRLRAGELTGVSKAIDTLTEVLTVSTFLRASTAFIQLSSAAKTSNAQARRVGATLRLTELARRIESTRLARMALRVKRSNGHFDEVMASIDKMIASLRQEEQADIEHRDRCQNAQKDSNDNMADISAAEGKAFALKGRKESEKIALGGKISALDREIEGVEREMQGLLTLRDEAVADSRQALRDDAEAQVILSEVLAFLSAFHKQGREPLALVASTNNTQELNAPNYTIDRFKAPETTWSDGNYGGRKDETYGVVSILETLREGFENEMKIMRQDSAAAEQQYEEQREGLRNSRKAHKAVRLALRRELVRVQAEQDEAQEAELTAQRDEVAEQEHSTALVGDCSWVASHFDSRRQKRKVEIQGLADAKAFLSGSVSDDLI